MNVYYMQLIFKKINKLTNFFLVVNTRSLSHIPEEVFLIFNSWT